MTSSFTKSRPLPRITEPEAIVEWLTEVDSDEQSTDGQNTDTSTVGNTSINLAENQDVSEGDNGDDGGHYLTELSPDGSDTSIVGNTSINLAENQDVSEVDNGDDGGHYLTELSPDGSATEGNITENQYITEIDSGDDSGHYLPELSPDDFHTATEGNVTENQYITEIDSGDDSGHYLTEFSADDSDTSSVGNRIGPSEIQYLTEVESGGGNYLTEFSADDSEKENNARLPVNKKRTRKVHFEDFHGSTSSNEDVDTTLCRGSTTINYISATLQKRCCVHYCVKHVTFAAASAARDTFGHRTSYEQRQWVLDYFNNHHDNHDGCITFRYLIGTSEVCSTAWRTVIGITKTRFYQIRNKFEGGSRQFCKPNAFKKGIVHQKTSQSMAWLEGYANKHGDKLPDTGHIHLPSCLSKGDVYQMMAADMETMSQESCKQAMFFRVWRRDFRHIAIPKENRFAKCDKCTLYKMSLEKTLDKDKRKALYEKRDRHLKLQNNERRKYYKHSQKAKSSPNLYMSIIIDGMDQKSTHLPNFLVTPKSLCSMWKLPTHITGVIVHGRGQHAFIDFKEIPHDSNNTINVLLQTLVKYPRLPPTLYIQLDNCGRENKNMYVLGLCALLVEMGIFKKIKTSFLMVGHTHEDIDQLFSRFSVHMWRNRVHTVSRLLELLPGAYNKPNTTAERLQNTVNFRDWIAPCLNSMAQHSRPHVFKFSLNEVGKAVMHTKKWSSTGEAWSQCVIAEGAPSYLLINHPVGGPQAVQKDFAKLDLKKLKQSILKAGEFLEAPEVEEWTNFLSQLDEECNAVGNEETADETEIAFPLYDILANCRERESRSNQEQTTDILAEDELSDDDILPVQVCLGKGKRKNKSGTSRGGASRRKQPRL